MGQLTAGSWLEQLIILALQQVLQKGVESPQRFLGTADSWQLAGTAYKFSITTSIAKRSRDPTAGPWDS